MYRADEEEKAKKLANLYFESNEDPFSLYCSYRDLILKYRIED